MEYRYLSKVEGVAHLYKRVPSRDRDVYSLSMVRCNGVFEENILPQGNRWIINFHTGDILYSPIPLETGWLEAGYLLELGINNGEVTRDTADEPVHEAETPEIGKATTEVGIKYDSNKPQLAECFIDFEKSLQEVCKVWEFGKDKYGKSNWKSVAGGYERYSNALMRHMLKEETEVNDPETKLLHASHVAWNALVRLYFLLENKQEDN